VAKLPKTPSPEIRSNNKPFHGEKMALRSGQYAPDFTLENHLGDKTRLSDFLGKKNVVLAFFPLAWTPV
jgi:cytochrome oxidase Cu insertion factor (SCO1/SenC/PrrC family)